MSAPGPTGARRRLGTELRRLRSKAGLHLEDVAEQVPCSASKLSRLETGKGVPKLVDVHRLIELYRVESETEREMLLRLVHDGRAHGWWESYTEGLAAERFVLDAPGRYTALEADATTVRAFEVVVLPGLVQTPDYARAVFGALLADRNPAEIEQLVSLRTARQRALTRALRPLELNLVVDEAVLARPVGSGAVMAGQLRHLLELAELGNVELRVLPLTAGFHRAHAGQFTVLEFGPESGAGDVVFVEGQAGANFLEGPADVALYRGIFDDVTRRALDPTLSCRMIDRWGTMHADSTAKNAKADSTAKKGTSS